jgi:DNA-binding PadR family transcriptional regulator
MARKSQAGPAFDPELLILSSLAPGPKHGYAMLLDIEEFAGTAIGPGTLYTALTRLVEKGWVRPQSASGRQRPYQLTATGAAHLKEQLTAMQRMAQTGLRRLCTA